MKNQKAKAKNETVGAGLVSARLCVRMPGAVADGPS